MPVALALREAGEQEAEELARDGPESAVPGGARRRVSAAPPGLARATLLWLSQPTRGNTQGLARGGPLRSPGSPLTRISGPVASAPASPVAAYPNGYPTSLGGRSGAAALAGRPGASCRWSDSAAAGAAIGHIFSRSERDVRAHMDERRGTVGGFPEVQEARVALSETCRGFSCYHLEFS